VIHGRVDPRFMRVRDAFARNFAERGELGASLVAIVDGRAVVDLWGGHADPARERPWREDTLVMVHSCTKGATAFCAHLLAARGALDVDAPVARYWPEFAAAGKQDIPVRWLLSHRAGLPAIRPTLPAAALLDWTADGAIDISDALSVLAWLFLAEGRPHPLGETCTRIRGCPGACRP